MDLAKMLPSEAAAKLRALPTIEKFEHRYHPTLIKEREKICAPHEDMIATVIEVAAGENYPKWCMLEYVLQWVAKVRGRLAEDPSESQARYWFDDRMIEVVGALGLRHGKATLETMSDELVALIERERALMRAFREETTRLEEWVAEQAGTTVEPKLVELGNVLYFTIGNIEAQKTEDFWKGVEDRDDAGYPSPVYNQSDVLRSIARIIRKDPQDTLEIFDSWQWGAFQKAKDEGKPLASGMLKVLSLAPEGFDHLALIQGDRPLGEIVANPKGSG